MLICRIINLLNQSSHISARLGSQRYLIETLKCKAVQSVKQTFRTQSTKTAAKETSTISLRLLGLSCGAGLIVGKQLFNSESQVYCEAKLTSRIIEDEQSKQPKFDWNRFWELLRPHWWYLIIAVSSAFVVAILNIEIPRLLGDMINVVSNHLNNDSESAAGNYWQELKVPAMRLGIMYVAQAAFTFVYIHTLSCVGERMACQLRQDLFSAIVRQDIAFFDSHRTGELVNRLTTDVQDFKSSFKLCVSQGLRSITQTIGCMVSMYLISPPLTLYMATIVPVVIGVGSLLGKFLRNQSRAAQAQVAKSTAVCDEALSNIRTVRAFAMEEKEMELYAQELEKARIMQENLGMGIGLFQSGANLFLNGIVLGTVGIGGSLLSSGQIKPGDLMAFLVATQTIQRSLAQLSLLFGHYVRGTSAGSRVFEYIHLEPSIPLQGGKTIPFHSLFGQVEFKNVYFSYPTRQDQKVLKDFTLTLPAGKVVALVGSSGGGKSTVAALLERFYDTDSGEITIDGHNVKNLDPTWLRGRAIGFINQEPILFASSIIENIRYGKPSASDFEVMEAAKLANADDFIRSFPNGYATRVGERGVTISGGQKQRIAIARALLKNPSILILDEATSALDAESEKLVQDALDKVAAGRTVLIVAHRLSTIQNADIIAVVSKGTIAEVGTHKSLVDKRGLYWNLIRQQQQNHSSPSAGA
ncbi:mitochondrial potassium channel ATP-binding subunit [Daphnia magna]|uniref:mitochondrial potassium channel ATP-binding subunit n=1 Tax=Daphnia magna TaxID=35525 RepID=UPI001E1BCD64|nr:mitochondrial potassium channel ATP-binding subunit [Daphnia magna]WEU39101.1 NIES ABC protein [Daphnia magna]